ncbi:hypothetical protein JIY74_30555 [Vibrio harveyi]|nr:hypothetical protein [Vibrio harveyi]
MITTDCGVLLAIAIPVPKPATAEPTIAIAGQNLINDGNDIFIFLFLKELFNEINNSS